MASLVSAEAAAYVYEFWMSVWPQRSLAKSRGLQPISALDTEQISESNSSLAARDMLARACGRATGPCSATYYRFLKCCTFFNILGVLRCYIVLEVEL